MALISPLPRLSPRVWNLVAGAVLGAALGAVAGTARAQSLDSLDWNDVVRQSIISRQSTLAEAWLDDKPEPRLARCAEDLWSLNADHRVPEGLWRALFARWGRAHLTAPLAFLGKQADSPGPALEAAAAGWAWAAALRYDDAIAALREATASTEVKAVTFPALARVLPGPDVAAVHGQVKRLISLDSRPDVLSSAAGAAGMRAAELIAAGGDRKAGLDYLESLGRSEFSTTALERIWLNPDETLSPSEAFSQALNRHSAEPFLGWIAFRWFEGDPQRAWKQISELPKARRQSVMSGLASAVAERRPAEIPWLLDRVVLADLAPASLGQLGRFWLQHDEAAACRWIQAHKHELEPGFWDYILPFALESPSFCRFFLNESVTPQQAGHGTTHQALIRLGTDSPQEAIAWIQKTMPRQNRSYALAAQLSAWGPRHPEIALQLLENLEINELGEAILKLFEDWGRRDFPAAADRAQRLPPHHRDRAVLAACMGSASTRPRETASRLVAILKAVAPPEENTFGYAPLPRAIARVGVELWAVSPDTALRWLHEEVPPNHRLTATQLLVRTLTPEERESGATQFARLPPGSVKDAWLDHKAQWTLANPHVGFLHALEINDPMTRFSSCQAVVNYWRRLDPIFCRHFLEKAPMDEPLRQQLLATFETP